MTAYDPGAAASFYDTYGEREWTRFDDGRTGLVSFEIHRHYPARAASRSSWRSSARRSLSPTSRRSSSS
jgi:hypothetical protein